jgi:hypothetical protein
MPKTDLPPIINEELEGLSWVRLVDEEKCLYRPSENQQVGSLCRRMDKTVYLDWLLSNYLLLLVESSNESMTWNLSRWFSSRRFSTEESKSKRSELLQDIKSILKWKSVGKWDEWGWKDVVGRGMSLNWISCFTAWARWWGSDHCQAATSLLMEFMPQAVQCAYWHAKPCCQQCSCCH